MGIVKKMTRERFVKRSERKSKVGLALTRLGNKFKIKKYGA